MKYIITEQQKYILQFLRRSSREFLKPYIDSAIENNFMTLEYCEENSSLYYVEDVINYAVDLILSDIDDDMAKEDHYDELFELFNQKCLELFEDDITEVFNNYCS